MTKHWASEQQAEIRGLRSQIKMRAYCDLIMQLFSPSEQDEIIAVLQDPTKNTRIELHIFADEIKKTEVAIEPA